MEVESPVAVAELTMLGTTLAVLAESNMGADAKVSDPFLLLLGRDLMFIFNNVGVH